MAIKANLRARRRRRRIMWVSIVAVVIALVLVVYLATLTAKQSGNTALVGKPVSPAILQELTRVSDATLNAVGAPSGVTPPVSISGSQLTLGGKPEFLYVGAEYCPFCAIERWSMIVALSRFGTFHGLEYMVSGDSPEINPDTPTFTFANTTFTSSYVSFVEVEQQDRFHGNLQSTTAEQQSIISQYDTCAATGSNGGIPFIDIANAYAVNCGSQFQLPSISGGNWTQIAPQLNNPSSNEARLIDGAANYLISAICKVTNGQPTSVCTQGYATETLAYSPTGAGGAQANLLAVPTRPVD